MPEDLTCKPTACGSVPLWSSYYPDKVKPKHSKLNTFLKSLSNKIIQLAERV